jgi:peroxiredoxin
MSSRPALLLAGALALALAASDRVASAAPPASRPSGPTPGKPAPAFSLRDRDGALVSLSDLAYAGEERRGRPRRAVVIDFFRTDCEPCKKSLPRLGELHKKLAARGLRVIMIALLEDEEGQEKLDRFLKQRPQPFLVLVDPYGAAAKKYLRSEKGGYEIPALFVIDKRGVLRLQARGLTSELAPKVTKLVEDLLR